VTGEDDIRFWGWLMVNYAHEIKTPAIAVYGLARTLLSGDVEVDERKRQEFIELIRDEGERLIGLAKHLRQAAAIALGEADALRADMPTVNARQIADQAQALLAEEEAATVTVSGEGVAVLADEWAAGWGFASIVQRIVRYQGGLNLRVEGAEIMLSPVPADDEVRRFVTGNAPEIFEVGGSGAGWAVRVIRGLGGSVDLDGDTLKFRFPEPRSSEEAR
jgi:hypothetical protein